MEKKSKRQAQVVPGGERGSFSLKSTRRRNDARKESDDPAEPFQSPGEIQVLKKIQLPKTTELKEDILAHEHCLIAEMPADEPIAQVCQQTGNAQQRRYRIVSSRKGPADHGPIPQTVSDFIQASLWQKSVSVQEQKNFPARVTRAKIRLAGPLPAGAEDNTRTRGFRDLHGFIVALRVHHDCFESRLVRFERGKGTDQSLRFVQGRNNNGDQRFHERPFGGRDKLVARCRYFSFSSFSAAEFMQ